MADTPRIVWAASLTVAAAAVYATAHGLYGVAVASGVPPAVAVVYPVLADGLALVAYASTRRLTGGQLGYAWSVVALSAGLSGVAQAAWLASDVLVAPTWLRAGVGGWPAVAALLAAHLVYLAAPRHEVAAPAQIARRQAAHTEQAASDGLGPRPALDRDDTTTVTPTPDKAKRIAEVARLDALGWTNKAVAAHIGVHERTVSRYRSTPPNPLHAVK